MECLLLFYLNILLCTLSHSHKLKPNKKKISIVAVRWRSSSVCFVICVVSLLYHFSFRVGAENNEREMKGFSMGGLQKTVKWTCNQILYSLDLSWTYS